MAIDITFEEYREELEATATQNPAECDLYPLIWCLLKSCASFGDLSVRCTSDLKHSVSISTDSRMYKTADNKGDIVYGSLDFVVFGKKARFDKDETDDKPLGAVEVKALGFTLAEHMKEKRNIKQLGNGLEKFGSVLYTNGLEWKYIEKGTSFKDAVTVSLGTFSFASGKYVSSGDRIIWNSEKEWSTLKRMLNNIKWGKKP